MDIKILPLHGPGIVFNTNKYSIQVKYIHNKKHPFLPARFWYQRINQLCAFILITTKIVQ